MPVPILSSGERPDVRYPFERDRRPTLAWFLVSELLLH